MYTLIAVIALVCVVCAIYIGVTEYLDTYVEDTTPAPTTTLLTAQMVQEGDVLYTRYAHHTVVLRVVRGGVDVYLHTADGGTHVYRHDEYVDVIRNTNKGGK